eukprot:gb/GECG01007298.1/.p1 GENE.gb/GECG01007298.1/~~gb/GECG01007298.1/.p1  ORF type:complete len:179 (+),score=15.79 gb/GECG01007298.1/:1-537(+)
MSFANEVKLFGQWSYEGIDLGDISLDDYVACSRERGAVYLPHTAGRYQLKRFRKAQCPIVERLVNSLMFHGRNTGKKAMAIRIVQHAFEIVNLLTDENPIQVLARAIVNSGPREDSTRIGTAGVVRRQAVDLSPFRRINQAIHLLAVGVSVSVSLNIFLFCFLFVRLKLFPMLKCLHL